MKIYTVFTGGTIGSILNESGYIGPREGTPFRLLSMYQEQFPTDIEFETVEPYRILSENLGAENLLCLFGTIRQILEYGDADGIVVTHGTDTLQYGAAMMGYVFGASSVPIVLVSSNYVLEDKRSNGLTNFRYAVEFIKGQRGRGVFVSYYNKGEYPTIHRATRLQPLIPYSDYVSSVQDTWYGRFENENYISNPEYHVMEGQVAISDKIEKIHLTEDANGILLVRPYVGMTYPELSQSVKAVLHSSFHSGTICVEKGLQHFVQEAKQSSIPIYLTGLLAEEDHYETVRIYEEMGIQPLHTSSEVAQYCKLWLALSNNLDVQQVMSQSVAEDWI